MTTFKLQSLRRIGRALLVAPLFVVGQTCTSLTEVPHDALTGISGDAEVLAGVVSVYAQLRSTEWVGYITIQDLTTDVSIIPWRGGDWNDNGQWLDLHRQTFTPNSAGTGAFLQGSWNDLFSGIAKANLMIDAVTKAGGVNAPSTLAELRTLRAWYYYMLQDMFGGAPPLVTTTELKKYPSSTRTALFNFIKTELIAAAAEPTLPSAWPSTGYGRITKGAANAILASLYMNAGVFNKNTGINATTYNTCTPHCQDAIDAANVVINSGLYSLSPLWKDNFDHDNNNSPENIFVIVYTGEGRELGGNWPMRTLHYNQISVQGGPWNGFATLAETYNAFDATDERRAMWLQGQAFNFATNQPVNDRTGAPLIFTVAIPDAEKAGEGTGVRFNKFPPLTTATWGSGHPSDFPLFRLAEMHLIKAEALNELNQTAAAMVELNFVHDKRNAANPVAGGLNQQGIRDAILKERLLEFAGEGKRRSDLIRHGKFLTWTEASLNGVCGPTGVCSGSRNAKLILFPVPINQLASNPNLVQNPGY